MRLVLLVISVSCETGAISDMKLWWVFVWLGLTVAAILFSFHLYLRERREVTMEVGRLELLTRGDWGAAPMTSRLTRYGDTSLRKLTSLDKDGSHGNVMSEKKFVTESTTQPPAVLSEEWEEEKSVGWEDGEEVEGEEGVELEDEKEVELEDGEGAELEDGEGVELEDEEGVELEDEEGVELEDGEGVELEDEEGVELEEGRVQLNWAKTGLVNWSDQFFFQSPFSLPTPKATLPLPQLLQCDWLNELRGHLTSFPRGSLVSLVSSDYNYREILLNWLLTAQVRPDRPLSNVLVLSLDASLHQLLIERHIPCVHIPTSCLLSPSLKLTRHIAFTQVHIMRVLVMRILNHWGYDVANYDSDALILKNPEPRYNELRDCHLIGSVGHFPQKMNKEWGTAICIGVVMIRASPVTGKSLNWITEASQFQIIGKVASSLAGCGHDLIIIVNSFSLRTLLGSHGNSCPGDHQ